jgi:AIR synthase-related protein
MNALSSLVEELRKSPGFARKQAIRSPLAVFKDVWNVGETLDPIGDDAAILVTGNDYLLLSCDAIVPRLVAAEPFWAGYCAVLVSVNDIYAMGGRPTAVVNLLSAPNDDVSVTIAQGMAEACRKFGVPMVGGHFLPEEPAGVATAILGKASHLLRGSNGKAGQLLMAAIDLEGRPFQHYLQWDSTSFREPQELQRKLEILPCLAERRLATAARDISNAGILGTLSMLAEASGCGASVDLSKIPRPDTVEMTKWLQMFPGYGFILAVNPNQANEVEELFHHEHITARVIGELTEDTQVVLHLNGDEAVLFDWSGESLVVGQHGGEKNGSVGVLSGGGGSV